MTLVLNPDRFDFQPETVTLTFLDVPDQGLLELEGLGVQFFLDLPNWGENAPNPHGGRHLLSNLSTHPTLQLRVKMQPRMEMQLRVKTCKFLF